MSFSVGKLFFCLHILAITELCSAQIDLGAAKAYGILGQSSVTNTGPTTIIGDIGTGGTSVTGFPPGVLTGSIIISGGATDAAFTDARAAYTTVFATKTPVDLTGKDLGGLTLGPGSYKFDSLAQLTGTLTLNKTGNLDGQWYFQIASSLNTAVASSVVFVNGGSACNVYWAVGSSATLGTATSFIGTIIAQASVTLGTGANLNGRAFGLTATVTMDTNDVLVPNCPAPILSSSTSEIVSIPTAIILTPSAISSTTISLLITSSSSLGVPTPTSQSILSSSLRLSTSASQSTLSSSTSSPQILSPSSVITISRPISPTSVSRDVSTGLRDLVTSVSTGSDSLSGTQLTIESFSSTNSASSRSDISSSDRSSIATSSSTASSMTTSSLSTSNIATSNLATLSMTTSSLDTSSTASLSLSSSSLVSSSIATSSTSSLSSTTLSLTTSSTATSSSVTLSIARFSTTTTSITTSIKASSSIGSSTLGSSISVTSSISTSSATPTTSLVYSQYSMESQTVVSTPLFVDSKYSMGVQTTLPTPVTYHNPAYPTSGSPLIPESPYDAVPDDTSITVVETKISTLTFCLDKLSCTGQTITWTGTKGPLPCSAYETCSCVLPGGTETVTSRPTSPTCITHTTYWTGTYGPTACSKEATCSQVLTNTIAELQPEPTEQVPAKVIAYTYAASGPVKAVVTPSKHDGSVPASAPSSGPSTSVMETTILTESNTASIVTVGLFSTLLLSLLTNVMLQAL